MKSAKLPINKLYLILIPCAIIIFSSSIETLMKVKDISLYQQWLKAMEYSSGSPVNGDQAFQAYVVSNLVIYFLKVIMPIALSINGYLAYTHTRINQLFIFLWSILVLGGLAYTVAELSFYSVFYYVNIGAYGFLLGVILSLVSVIYESKL